MTLSELAKISTIEKVCIHSLESNLYQLSIISNGEEHYITDQKGKFVTSHNKLDLQHMFDDKHVDEMVLCHQSAYDEMVGQPIGETNVLEVPLGEPFN
ncbi:hypothetical protein MAQ5080_00035 [Marinomonas aquimarina]|uniref:Na(+)-translocating NADH-quinone reductase subunit B n=1 Tax=Marinomonas aquimarina TaxID=295068 RepID=A0A1A8SYT5_9GAMM|nr:DUF6482 family protein [Marinomonas aquimarina]SBS24575.1 hypothetical protein MAQ5080_00035 [Marinomonas aquimarina]